MNQLKALEEIEKIRDAFTGLKDFDFKQNPFVNENESNYIFQILAKFQQLELINGHKVTRNMRRQTIDFQIWQKEEQKRLEREEEERLAREEEEEA